MADAAQLPLVGQFDLITATFNVLNHLPDEGAAASLVGEVARLLAPAGLFVFDVDTELGLRRTSELIEIHAAESDHTVWRRRWAGNRLLLHATGSFLDGEIRHEYGETIEKLVVHTEQVDGWCAAAGLSRPSWRSDDLVTRLDEPERVSVAYGIVRGPAVRP